MCIRDRFKCTFCVAVWNYWKVFSSSYHLIIPVPSAVLRVLILEYLCHRCHTACLTSLFIFLQHRSQFFNLLCYFFTTIRYIRRRATHLLLQLSVCQPCWSANRGLLHRVRASWESQFRCWWRIELVTYLQSPLSSIICAESKHQV